MSNTKPYLDKSEVCAWMRVRMKRDRVLNRAVEMRAKPLEIQRLYYELSDELEVTFRPSQHGLEVAHLQHVLLQFIDPLREWGPQLRQHYVQWPDFDPNLHHEGREVLDVPDEVLARRNGSSKRS